MNEPAIPEMTRRSTQIFNEIVKNYLQTGSPVGSGLIAAASEVNLSSASVRAIMAELEGSGLLFSPHTSAGRVPTRAGLRLFVDGLMEVRDSLALDELLQKGLITAMPLRDQVAAISCGMVNGQALADLDYNEDSSAETDANFVLTASGGIVEIQGTAEQHPFSEAQLLEMMGLAKSGCQQLFEKQMQAVRTLKA